STTWGGTLYRFSLPDGPYEISHSFTPETGRHPTGQLVQVGDWLYGTASDFFQHDGGYHGSLYRLHRIDGTFELLHQFNGASEGGHPYDDLYHDGADKLYGTTFGQVANPSSKGTIFVYSISNDTLTVLHDFSASPGTGSKPNGALIADQSGNYLYGLSHGSNAEGGDIGTLYRIKPDGTGFTLLHRFASGLAGNTPMRSLVRTQGRFFGVTAFGGLTVDTANPETGGGFIFQYTPVDAPSDARVAYVEWLAENGLLVNQSTESDEDSDGLSLLEEFAYVGIPDMADQPREITLSGFNTGSVEAVIPVIRSTATPLVIPLISTDLQNWEDATGSAQATITDSESNPGLQTMSFQWPDSVLQSGPFFIRFELDLDN
ncbi:MAG TPA: choice-of-anchor tandem repeat GloVer-containing protein, partial [Oceanipulchritudo sp.]|nr:choice-of-anchor tandem repeat GloVer-containing protein [Oceanipulchritudo sp.]